MAEDIRHFNIRVYGIVINENNQVLITDEYLLDQKMTKFPGGGMKFGEGPADCMKREALEEFGQEVEIVEHFYTTEFYQKSLFHKDHQIISIYYLIKFKDKIRFNISTTPFDFHELKNGNWSFRWIKIKDLSDEVLSFPIDRHVARLLRKKYC
ncbi:MAG: NUDIX domain-containing protein [Bacteroidales bacterium]|nr:MAG: NUDIX domain-containing protein [Bacteroidales bacterium]